ncbi:hypothetical protein Pcinc_023918 [Petrolisthes cinctipes]|uniref:Uncharacterized protein n=1 Tax=Petrolisthes cinctipes TaxID=88211 RepID=A0AAE1KED2_PETCI|nr:hypothetical protein Pcinc_023918 [Petrolisthes cinctipes]
MASTKPLAFKEVRATLKRIFESSVGSVNDFDHGVQVKEEPLYVTKTTDKQEIREVISMKNKKEDVMWTSYGTWRGNGRNWSRRSTNHRDGFYRLANNAARMIIMKARGVESGTVIQSAPQIRLRPGNRDPG